MTNGKATSSSSKKTLQIATFQRRCRGRGISFKPHVYSFLVCFSKELGLSVSAVVNLAVERFLGERLNGDVKSQFMLEAKREQLLAEERSLRERLRVILRSGAYLKDYVKELLLGDSEQISNLTRRVGVYSHVKPKELNIILRILKRREDLVNELLEIEDKLLPSEAYPFMVTEHGWKVGDSIYARDKLRRLSQAKTGSSRKHKTGGEK